MELKLFDRKGGRYTNPSITITTAGQIGINSACLEKYFKGKEYVLLYGDKTRKAIGIQPINKYQDNAFKISFSYNKKVGSISGHSFLNYLEVNFKKGSEKYTPQWNEEKKMLIIKFR